MTKNKSVVITAKEDKIYYGLFHDGAPVELYCDIREKNIQLGDIFVARVDQVAEGIHGAFVTLAKGENAFYRMNKSYPKELIKFTAGHEGKLYGGDLILVQILKESTGEKLPVVTERIVIQSAYFVLSFADYRLSVSKKITQKDEKDRLMTLMKNYKEEEYGLLARTAAKDVKEEILEKDLNLLVSEYQEIIRKGSIAPGGTMVYSQPSHYITLAKEMPFTEVGQIVTDSEEIYQDLLGYYKKQSYSQWMDKIRLYQDSYSLWSLYRFSHYYEMALGRKVYLRNGGSIVIDQTEALTAIDVNSGSVIKRKHADEIYFQINLDAGKEILKQMRIRNLSGIIIVDFINMKEKSLQEKLLSHLREECLADRLQVQIVDITSLGLVEIVRERRLLSLKEQWKKGVDIK